MSAAATPAAGDGRLTVDRLPDPADPVHDLTVQEIGHRTGLRDPLYFSRAFKRHRGESPHAYRGRVREKSLDR